MFLGRVRVWCPSSGRFPFFGQCRQQAQPPPPNSIVIAQTRGEGGGESVLVSIVVRSHTPTSSLTLSIAFQPSSSSSYQHHPPLAEPAALPSSSGLFLPASTVSLPSFSSSYSNIPFTSHLHHPVSCHFQHHHLSGRLAILY